ncbi:FG-GAP repeat domain-containing protein [Rhodothermus marinus]|uniref:FG-GAP repeat domain-containing protein n=1 Tax=Rhodothermus marinus TaxID=29549 RepID=UPI001FB1EF11|nr:VCBS repeat-containing protein [Rhodothermus marinus]
MLFVQQPDGRFARTNGALFAADALSEDLGAAFFDADGDGDLDLYVVSGGNAYAPRAPALQDRLYLNDGRGRFRKAVDRLPRIRSSGGPVAAADYDGDGDVDLFVGGRIEPWFYGMAPESLLLQNDGRGHFTNVTETLAPGLSRIGMVTDAAWTDFDGDGRLDLLVVGEWMPLTIFRNVGGGRLERWELPELAETSGIWHRVAVADFDADGDPDFIATNLGLNTPLKATPESPLRLFVKDFDRNGFADHLLTRPESTAAGLRHRPLNLRRELLGQLPFLSGRIPSHAAYARMMLEDILKPEELEGAAVLEVRELRSLYVENLGGGRFRLYPLPPEAQWAPLYGLLVDDFDGDGHLDVLAGGNFRWAQTSLGLMEATYGLWLRGDGAGHFTAAMPRDSGFFVRGEVRDVQKLTRPGRPPLILVARNDDTPRFFVVRW